MQDKVFVDCVQVHSLDHIEQTVCRTTHYYNKSQRRTGDNAILQYIQICIPSELYFITAYNIVQYNQQ